MLASCVWGLGCPHDNTRFGRSSEAGAYSGRVTDVLLYLGEERLTIVQAHKGVELRRLRAHTNDVGNAGAVHPQLTLPGDERRFTRIVTTLPV